MLLPILFAYFGFVLMSWLAYPLFNLLLRIDRFGRYALSPDQVKGANVLVACLVITLACLGAAIATGHRVLYEATVMCAVLALPASAIYMCEAGWPRHVMTAITLILGALIAFVATVVLLPTATINQPLRLPLANVMRLLPWGLLASQFAAMYLSRVTQKR